MRLASPYTLVLTLLVAVLVPGAARAQEPTVEDYRDRLPEQTVFCVSWQGLADLETLRATNPVLRMWASPEMKANWAALEEYQRAQARQRAGGQEDEAARARDSNSSTNWIHNATRLMANPGLIALVVPPPPADPAAPPPEPQAVMLYDTTGREELLAQLAAEDLKPGETRRTYEFEGMTVEETLDKNGKPRNYSGRVGRWLVSGEGKEAFEAWVRAVKEAPASSLRASLPYRQAQSLWSPGSQVQGFVDATLLMKMLARVPPSKPDDPPAAQVFEALDLARWEVLTFDATLDANSLRYQVTGQQGGDRDGLLGLLGSPVSEFPSLRLAPANAIAYSVAQVDLLAALNYLLAAVDALAPPQQAGMIQGVLAMAEGLLGAPLEQVMATWGSEYAQFSYADSDGMLRSLYVLSLRDREQALAMLRHVAEKNVVFLPIEEVPGSVADEPVYFRFLSGPSEANEPPKATLHLAVAGDWLLVSERQEELEAALARAGGASPFLGQSPAYQQARGRFPASLSGFSFVDAERWLETDAAQALLRAILEGAGRSASEPDKESEAEAEAEAEPESEPEPDPNADSEAEPAPAEEPAEAEEPPIPFPELQIPRGYLKWLLSATTRDARSFRFVGIVE